MQKVGVSIVSRLGITAAIAVIVAAVLGGGYWWVKSNGPRDTVKDKPTGAKVEMEELSFYGKDDAKVVGKVYRQADIADNDRPAVIYIQDVSYGDGWCKSIAATGAVCYAFDFQSEGERARAKELDAVLKGIKNLRYVDPGRIFLLGEGNGCLAACNAAFSNPKKVKGLILVSPGFNPLEISRKAKRYNGTILVVDDARGREANLKEIQDFIY
jgi:hypothetical protein